MRNSKKVFESALIALSAIIIFGYAFYQARNIISGPIIKIQNPKNGETLERSLVNIEGTAENISHISMNDRQIFTNEQGEFSEKLLLSYGYNIITIRVKDRFGRQTEEILELIYK